MKVSLASASLTMLECENMITQQGGRGKNQLKLLNFDHQKQLKSAKIKIKTYKKSPQRILRALNDIVI